MGLLILKDLLFFWCSIVISVNFVSGVSVFMMYYLILSL